MKSSDKTEIVYLVQANQGNGLQKAWAQYGSELDVEEARKLVVKYARIVAAHEWRIVKRTRRTIQQEEVVN